MKLVTCKNCGWVSIELKKSVVIGSVARFNEYFKSLSRGEQLLYYRGKKSYIKDYKVCFRCGGSYKKFRDYDSKTDANIDGHTINPILRRTE